MTERLSLEVRGKLKEYKNHTSGDVSCLECGYKGVMGIVPGTATVPWYLSLYVIIPLILTGVGIVAAIILGFLRGRSKRHLVDCPECGSRLGPV